MNERIKELKQQATFYANKEFAATGSHELWTDLFSEKFAELIVKECAKELREAEQEADRAYKAKEVKERNTFNGYDFADMLEERFGVE
jgi:hypothetical protein